MSLKRLSQISYNLAPFSSHVRLLTPTPFIISSKKNALMVGAQPIDIVDELPAAYVFTLLTFDQVESIRANNKNVAMVDKHSSPEDFPDFCDNSEQTPEKSAILDNAAIISTSQIAHALENFKKYPRNDKTALKGLISDDLVDFTSVGENVRVFICSVRNNSEPKESSIDITKGDFRELKSYLNHTLPFAMRWIPIKHLADDISIRATSQSRTRVRGSLEKGFDAYGLENKKNRSLMDKIQDE